MRTRRRRSLPG